MIDLDKRAIVHHLWIVNHLRLLIHFADRRIGRVQAHHQLVSSVLGKYASSKARISFG